MSPMLKPGGYGTMTAVRPGVLRYRKESGWTNGLTRDCLLGYRRRGVRGKKIMKQLRPDSLSEELVRLAPEVSVNGGCFDHWLARPATLSSNERANHWEQARSDATSLCVQDLLEKEGLPGRNLGRQDTGNRKWPAGYVGSVSHKGTKVAAVLGASNLVTSVGIDIELRSGASDLSGIPGLSLEDGTVVGQEVESEVIVFSVKEALFKQRIR